VAALPGLLSLLRERPPQLQQQQLLQELTGGRLHSSCPQDSRFARSPAAAIIGEDMPRLTPINTGRRSSSTESVGPPMFPYGLCQSDPLPGNRLPLHSMQQQILLQLMQQQHAERSSGSFHGFPEASSNSAGSGGMPTPLLPGYTPTMMTPLTGVKYHYPGCSSNSNNAAPSAAAAAAVGGSGHSSSASHLPLQQLPVGGGSSSNSHRLSTGSSAPLTAPLSGPLRLPGTSSLARSGSLGTCSRHWYWQRTSAQPYELGGPEDDSKSVSDQDGQDEKLVDDVQPGCPDVMEKIQINNNWYV